MVCVNRQPSKLWPNHNLRNLPGCLASYLALVAPQTLAFSVGYSIYTAVAVYQYLALLKLTPTRVAQHCPTHLPTELKTCSSVFVKVDPLKPNLISPYAGLYMVVSKTAKPFKILKNDKIQSVAINNVKPCYSLKAPSDMTSGSPIFAIPDIELDLVSRQPSVTLNSQNHTDMEQNIREITHFENFVLRLH